MKHSPKLTWKEIAISHREFHLNVDSIGVVSLNERRPQPVVDIIVRNIAGNVRAPIDALRKVCETFFDPLCIQNERKIEKAENISTRRDDKTSSVIVQN